MPGLIPSKPYTFPPANNKIISSEVNSNFDTLYQMFDPSLVGIYNLNIHANADIDPTKIDGDAVVRTPSDVSATLEQIITSVGAGYSALILRAGHALPTESVLRLQTSGGGDVFEVDYRGYMFLAGNTNIYIGASGNDMVFKDVTMGAEYKISDFISSGAAADASETAKGLVEEATLAETDAGTAAGSTLARLFVNPAKLRAKRYHSFAASSGGTDAYAITLSPVIAAYTDGDVFVFEADVANTGAATLNVNAVGAKTIKKYGNVDLATGDIKAGSIVMVVYDADSDTLMLLSSIARPQISQDGSEIYAASSAGSDTYAVTLAPAPAAYTTGMKVRFKADVANTGPATLNVNALGAKSIVKNYNHPLFTGAIRANQIVEVVYDGTNFQLMPTALDLPAYQQMVPLAQAAGSINAWGSSADGDVLFCYGDSEGFIYRFERDAVTGAYFETHAVATTFSFTSDEYSGLVVLGDYVYLFGDNGSTGNDVTGIRFDKANLANEATLTVPSIDTSGAARNVTAWTDGTLIYIIQSKADTTVHKFSVSGTTLTAVGTATASAALAQNGSNIFEASFFDGTTPYVVRMARGNPNTFTIFKLTAADASSMSSSSKRLQAVSDGDTMPVCASIDPSRMYLGTIGPVYDEAGQIARHIHLIPATKP